LYNKYKKTEEVQKRLVFTNHTPEESGNQKTHIALLDKMSFFSEIPLTEIRAITRIEDDILDHTLAALRLSCKANGVSKSHLKTLENMWSMQEGVCNMISITNAQDFEYWHDPELYEALSEKDNIRLRKIKSLRKQDLFEIVADQCGEIYDENICTIVFAKRFTSYKRPDLLFYNMDRFHKLVTNKEKPVQIIWAGKPYPMDYAGIGTFDKIVDVCKKYFNCSILVGYELKLSKILKRGADVWLNVPRLEHEASGTSGMAAAMNGAVNVATSDGWIPEFAKDKTNSFLLPLCDTSQPDHIQDEADAEALYHLLESEVLPMYYDYPDRWLEIINQSMNDITPYFDSKRLAKEYYECLYSGQ
ncbi:MAG: alpha-glucan family phosphorylase, partial [Bacteroidota bacterium]